MKCCWYPSLCVFQAHSDSGIFWFCVKSATGIAKCFHFPSASSEYYFDSFIPHASLVLHTIKNSCLTHYWGFTCVIQATSETRIFWKNNCLDKTSLLQLWQRSCVSSFTLFFSVHLRERVFGWNQNFFSQIRWRPFLSNENQEESLLKIIKTGKRVRDTLIIVLRHKKWRWWIWQVYFYLRQR